MAGMVERMDGHNEKVNKPSVNSRQSRTTKRCGNCSNYIERNCSIVMGIIDPYDVCNRWEAKAT